MLYTQEQQAASALISLPVIQPWNQEMKSFKKKCCKKYKRGKSCKRCPRQASAMATFQA